MKNKTGKDMSSNALHAKEKEIVKHEDFLCCSCVHKDIADKAFEAGKAQAKQEVLEAIREFCKKKGDELNEVVEDEETGLLWQYKACVYRDAFDSIEEYLYKLNQL